MIKVSDATSVSAASIKGKEGQYQIHTEHTIVSLQKSFCILINKKKAFFFGFLFVYINTTAYIYLLNLLEKIFQFINFFAK